MPIPLPKQRTIGQGINPNARDPQDILTAGAVPSSSPFPRPQGVGRAVQPQAQQQQPAPTDLSDLSGLERVGLAFGEFGAGLQGQTGPAQRLIAQRKQEFEARRQQLLQGLQVLGQFQQAVDNAPVAQQAALKAKLRDQFITYAGSPEAAGLYDATVGSAGLSEGIIAQLSEDEGAKVLLASGASGKDIADYAKSEGFLERAVARQDQTALPNVERKVKGLLNSKDPEVQAKLKEIARDGVTTTEELKQLNELATRGPAGTQLTQAELGTLDRQQEALAQRIPGFQANEEIKKQREARANLEQKRQEAEIQAQKEIKVATAVAKATASQGPSSVERRDAQRVSQELVPAVTRAREKVELLKRAKKLHDDLFTGPIAGRVSGVVPSQKRQELEAIIARIQVNTVPKGQGQVSDFERRLFGKSVPGAESDAAIQIYDQLIQGYEQAIADDEARLGEIETITGRPTPRGVTLEKGNPEGTTKEGLPRTVVQDGYTYTLNEETGEYE